MVMLTSVERQCNVNEGKGGPDAVRHLTCVLLLLAGGTEARARVCAEGDASPGPVWCRTVGTSQSNLDFQQQSADPQAALDRMLGYLLNTRWVFR